MEDKMQKILTCIDLELKATAALCLILKWIALLLSTLKLQNLLNITLSNLWAHMRSAADTGCSQVTASLILMNSGGGWRRISTPPCSRQLGFSSGFAALLRVEQLSQSDVGRDGVSCAVSALEKHLETVRKSSWKLICVRCSAFDIKISKAIRLDVGVRSPFIWCLWSTVECRRSYGGFSSIDSKIRHTGSNRSFCLDMWLLFLVKIIKLI